MDKILLIKSTTNPTPMALTIRFFHQSRFHFDAFSFLLCAYHFFRLLVTKYILNSTELKCTQNIKLYHFVHTILSIPFCPIPFCPCYFVRSILSSHPHT